MIFLLALALGKKYNQPMTTTTTKPTNDNAPELFQPLQIGNTFETAFWRVHRYRESVEITRVEHAGKRGKKCERFHVSQMGYGNDDRQVSAASDAAVEQARANASVEAMAAALSVVQGIRITLDILRGIDTAMPTIKIHTDRLYLTCDGTSFTFCDLTDQANDPRTIDRNRVDARRVYDYVRAHKDEVAQLSYREVNALFAGMRIFGHSYCGMD